MKQNKNFLLKLFILTCGFLDPVPALTAFHPWLVAVTSYLALKHPF